LTSQSSLSALSIRKIFFLPKGQGIELVARQSDEVLRVIPQEVVAEAIVNAVVHRDYISNGSVQVMLFKDRLEVWNPGMLPPTLTLEKLRGPHASVPHNPLLAEPMYLIKYIERMGTGIRDMIRRCRDAGLAEPEIRIDGGFFVLTIRRKRDESAAQSGAQSEVILKNLEKEPLSAAELSVALDLQSKTGAFKRTLQELIDRGMIEYTIPGKPTSRLQKYRLTEKGRGLLEQLGKKSGRP
jgi:predicted HTH transcriptional regulator